MLHQGVRQDNKTVENEAQQTERFLLGQAVEEKLGQSLILSLLLKELMTTHVPCSALVFILVTFIIHVIIQTLSRY